MKYVTSFNFDLPTAKTSVGSGERDSNAGPAASDSLTSAFFRPPVFTHSGNKIRISGGSRLQAIDDKFSDLLKRAKKTR